MKIFGMGHIVAIVLSLLFMVGAVTYVAHRTSQWLGLIPTASYIIFFIFFLSIVGAMGSSWYINGTSPFQHIATLYGCYAAGFLLTLIFVMFMIDLLTVPFHEMHIVWKGITTYGITIALTILCCISAMRPRISEIHVPIRGLEQQMRVAQLSDMHLGHFRGAKWLDGVIQKVNDHEPDIVVITGDIFESHYNLTDTMFERLRNIKAPVYFVSGNHDKYVNLLRIKDMLRKVGVHVIDNELAEYNGLQIAGTGLEEVSEVIESIGINPKRPCILLRHYPNGVDEAIDHGVDLVLSGHTHGGQLFPVTLINKIGFKYNKGLYKVGKGYIYTSEGAGTTGPPLRFETHSEIALITLVPSGLK